MKILIGYDGSECAEAALIDLQRAGLPQKAEATVLSVADVFLPPKINDEKVEETFPLYVPHGVKLARERAANRFAEAEMFAARASAKIRELFPGWTVQAEARADSPHWALISKAEEWQPDLLVVGSQGRTALGRFVLGSVSLKVLYETSCSVRIARGKPDLPPDTLVKLVLGTDGSPDADAMIERVASRPWKRGALVKLVTAYETFHQYAVDPEVQMNRIRDIQTMAKENLTAAELEVEMLVTGEDPKSFLVREAEKWDADCIFLGAKGHRFFERLLLGSVSSSVAARAHCSVEIVRKERAG